MQTVLYRLTYQAFWLLCKTGLINAIIIFITTYAAIEAFVFIINCFLTNNFWCLAYLDREKLLEMTCILLYNVYFLFLPPFQMPVLWQLMHGNVPLLGKTLSSEKVADFNSKHGSSKLII